LRSDREWPYDNNNSFVFPMDWCVKIEQWPKNKTKKNIEQKNATAHLQWPPSSTKKKLNDRIGRWIKGLETAETVETVRRFPDYCALITLFVPLLFFFYSPHPFFPKSTVHFFSRVQQGVCDHGLP
jgi:hypothetical protein